MLIYTDIQFQYLELQNKPGSGSGLGEFIAHKVRWGDTFLNLISKCTEFNSFHCHSNKTHMTRNEKSIIKKIYSQILP